MKNKVIIALVGMPGSGKSEAVKYLEDKGLVRVYFGGITLEEIKNRGLEVNPINEKNVREGLRQQYGMGAYAILNQEKITQAFAIGSVVIDGLYSWSEYKVLKERFGEDLVLIAVVAPRQLRHQRLVSRPVRPMTENETASRDLAEIENLEKGGPIAIADYTIVNDETLEEFIQKLEKIYQQLIK